jgi:hypothetical protein
VEKQGEKSFHLFAQAESLCHQMTKIHLKR